MEAQKVKKDPISPESARFRAAYFKLSYGQRKEAKPAFCEAFKLAKITGDHKVDGSFNVSESEATWMEKYTERILNPQADAEPTR